MQCRWRWLRSLGVRLQSRVFRRVMDLANEAVEVDVRMLLAETERIRGASLPSGYAAMHASPNVAAWAYRMTVELPSLDGAMLGRVTRGVAAALPASEDESTGFHARPPEPLDALVFVGTRYAARTTDEMVGAVLAAYGWSDAELTDCFYAIGSRNAFERVDRLLAAPLNGSSAG